MQIPKRDPMSEKRKRLKKKVDKTPEKEIQSYCEQYLDCLGVKWFHIPEAIQAFVRLKGSPQIKNIANRCWTGLPDLICLFHDGTYLLLELKSQKGKLRDSQRAWSKGLNLEVAYSIDEAKEIIDNYNKAE